IRSPGKGSEAMTPEHMSAAAAPKREEDRVYIFDTTLRDGEQSPGATMTLEEKLQVAETLDDMGVDIIEAGFPIASNGDFEAVSEVAKRSKNSIIAGLARAIPADIARAGATTSNIPDAVGYAVTEEYYEIFRELITKVPGGDKVIWSTHCHNDLGLAVANSLAGVRAGDRQVECTINGLGERAGNAAL